MAPETVEQFILDQLDWPRHNMMTGVKESA